MRSSILFSPNENAWGDGVSQEGYKGAYTVGVSQEGYKGAYTVGVSQELWFLSPLNSCGWRLVD